MAANSLISPSPPGTQRIISIDLIRGAVMILMAIDHVRVYAGIPPGGPTIDVFLTRWITHFCAPAFLFLAGTSAFFYGRRHDDLPRFLLTRGLWLILLELTFLRVAWTFNFDFASYQMAGVIWVIGWSMIVLAGLSKLPIWLSTVFGFLLVAGHNLLDPSFGAIVSGLGEGLGSAFVKILYVGFYAGPITLGPDGPTLIVLYSLIPWVGVMALGYAFGSVLVADPSRRDRLCWTIGLGSIAAFLILRGFNLYGDLRPWSPPSEPWGMPSALAFLNTTKYPASLSFLLMTLGPCLALIPWLEKAKGAAADAVALFGRVPFFFYMLHIPLIHASALAVSLLRTGEISPWLFENHPMGNPPPPEGEVWTLWQLYAVWGVVMIILYYACLWFARVKAGRKEWWLRYL